MKVAIASGKGGTGKTTVATNLAWLASQQGVSTAYLDCDTEAPNGRLFLRPRIETTRQIYRTVPQVNDGQCTLCGICSEVCKFNAIIALKPKVMVFPELCHGCRACMLACPEKAITGVQHAVGTTEAGYCVDLRFVEGRLNVGEASSPPVIRAIKETVLGTDLLVFDAPPGTSCPMVETVRDADYVVLVTESTPFGLHDLKLALEVMKALKLDCGVVINRALPGRGEAREFCQQAGIPILVEIPDVIDIAEAGSRGELIIDTVLGTRRLFDQLLTRVLTQARDECKSLSLQSYCERAVASAAKYGVAGCNRKEHQHKACFISLRKGFTQKYKKGRLT